MDKLVDRADWVTDCLHWRGRILIGKYAHWCQDWDGLPIDETTPEFECCTCPKSLSEAGETS